jgi:hypothetical protein
VPHDVVEPKTGFKKKQVMQIDQNVQVCGILVRFSKHSLLRDSPLAFILEGVMLRFFLCSLIGAHFSMLLEHFFDDPSLLLQDHKKRNLFGLWTIFLVDGSMFCVTPGVGVSMYMWMYVISIMEAVNTKIW